MKHSSGSLSFVFCLFVIFVIVTPANGQSNSFWIWRGPIPKNVLSAEALYVHQGNFDRYGSRAIYRFQGVNPQQLPGFSSTLIPTYRLERLVAPGMVASRFVAHRRAWERHNVRVDGIQIDYDCPTAKLVNYADWLEGLKTKLGNDVPISITGLGDWLTSARAGELKRLSDNVQFIAFMMYHNGSPLPHIERYTKRLAKLSTPFFLGRLANQDRVKFFSDTRKAAGYRGDIIFFSNR